MCVVLIPQKGITEEIYIKLRVVRRRRGGSRCTSITGVCLSCSGLSVLVQNESDGGEAVRSAVQGRTASEEPVYSAEERISFKVRVSDRTVRLLTVLL